MYSPYLIDRMTRVRTTREFSIAKYDRALLPRGHGQLMTMAGTFTRRYPSRDHCMQMMSFFSTSSGLVIHTKDSTGSLSDWEVIPGNKLRIHFYGPEPEIEMQVIPPTVEAAALVYKKWALRQPWAQQTRQRAPDYGVIATAPNPNLAQQAISLETLSKRFPSPMAAWITNWRKYPFDNAFPNYEPNSRQNFSKLLSNLKHARCDAFPYINALLWDERLAEFQLGESVAVQSRFLSYRPYSQTAPWLLYACPASEEWQRVIVETRESLRDAEDYLSSGIYLDMLVAAGPFLCFSKDHAHRPGDPLAWQQGVRKILSMMKGSIMSEGNAEIYLNQVDLLLMHLFTEQRDTVPLWNLVYGDLSRVVGWRMPNSVTPITVGNEIDRAVSFGASCYGSPWMTHAIQEALLTPGFRELATRLGIT